jgi:TolB-like protein/DNA-binding winged helix-turn-helix (wHTH) protein/Tfp pilus assembly protein PilF
MPGDRVLEFGSFRLDVSGRSLTRGGELVPLPPKAIETLTVLAENQGKTVRKEELLEKVWPGTFVEEGSLTQNVSILRKALGDSSDDQKWIRTIPKRGYCFVAPVRLVPDAAEPLPSPPQVLKSKRQVMWWAVGLIAVLVAVSLVLLYPRHVASPSKLMRLLVLPVQNLSGDSEHDYVSDGLTEELIAQLSTLDATHLAVIARTSAMSYKGTSKTVGQIGQELGVDYVLESSLRWSGNRLRITALLVSTQDQSHVWAATYDRTPQDILVLEDEVAKAIAAQIHTNLSRSALPRPPKPEAYLPYMEGRYYWNKRTRESLDRAIVHLRQAIALDPEYARGYSALADCYMSLGLLGAGKSGEFFSQAKTAVLQALALDGNLAEAHTSLAYLKFWQDWDWPGAESEFKKAITLNPDYATAHQWYAEYLRLMRRFNESIDESNKALELDPLSLVINMEAGLPYYFQHQFDKAQEHFQRAIDLDPNFALAYVELGWVYEEMHDLQKAIATLEKAARLDDTTPVLVALGHAYAITGRVDDAKRILLKLERRAHDSYVPPFLLSAIYLGLGDREHALALLEKAYQEHDWGLVWLNVANKYDPLRSETRFIALMRRMNFPARSV